MNRSRNVGVALIGLLVVAAISMAAASGRKPPKEQQATVFLRRISPSEVMDILHRFPEMVPSYFASEKNNVGLLTQLFRFSEVTAAPLKAAFPGVRFYKGLDGKKPPCPYLMAIAGGKRYLMPGGLNQLLFDSDVKVTDANLIEIAKAFVILALGSRPALGNPELHGVVEDELVAFPKLTFLSAEMQVTDESHAAKLTVRIGGDEESWYFARWHDQLGWVSRRNAKGLIKQYPMSEARPLQQRGRLTPSMDVDTVSPSCAYAEWEGATPHYYVIVENNSSATGDSVGFSFSGFSQNSTNVYIRVADSIRNPVTTRLLDTVQIDGQGAGTYFWKPPTDSTGICEVWAETLDALGGYHPVTLAKELTPEKIRAGTFPGAATESLKVYFCDQFFRIGSHPQGEGHADVFAQYVKNAMLESWQKQVNEWSFGGPPDADSIHQVFVNDTVHWYHDVAINNNWADSGANRQIGIRSSNWYGSRFDSAYSSESIRVKVAVAHEFYHGIQWGLTSPLKWLSWTWDWFTEGQARFLPSVQYETEEFLDTNHYFPCDSHGANGYLRTRLNSSVKYQSYHYCLFWRFMYEKFLSNSIGIVRDCYRMTDSVGDNSIGQGKEAIDRAIEKYRDPGQPSDPRFRDFLHSIDEFAVACYLNDTSFGLWHDPNDVYSPPSLTADTTFRLGPSETDSIKVRDSVPHSYGFDLIQLRLNGDVDTLLVLCSPQGTATSLSLQARLVKVYPADSFDVDSMQGLSDTAQSILIQTKFPTRDAERVCLVITRHDTLDDTCGHYLARFNVKRAVGVSDSLPVSDTVIAGLVYTPKAIVANRGWMKEIFPATFKIEGTGYSDTKTCTLGVGGPDTLDTIEFEPWTTTKGNFPTCCSVYIASDTAHSDDTLWGSLVALADTWQTRRALPQGVGGGGSLAAVGDTLIYAFCGDWSSSFYCYDVRRDTWEAREPLPTFPVLNGASLTWDRGAHIYALRGCSAAGSHTQLYQYDIADNTWDEMPPNGLPGNFGTASALVWGAGHYLYALQGLEPTWTQKFFRYDTCTTSWTQMQEVPADCSLGASLCWDLVNSIYALRAHMSKSFYRCDTNASSWFTKTATPGFVSAGGALTYNSLDNRVYAWSGTGSNPTGFWRYDAVANNWTTCFEPPLSVGFGGALTSCAGFVYGLRGNGNPDFWRYAPSLPSEKTRLALAVDEPAGSLGITSCRFAVSPNPARGAVRVQWQFREPGVVTLRVFDNTGRVARTIQNGYQAAGRYSVRWDGICDNGIRAAEGVFFYRLDAPGFHKVVKVATVSR